MDGALSGIPDGFAGRLLEVPVGTGVLTIPLYRRLPHAQVTCPDQFSMYIPPMDFTIHQYLLATDPAILFAAGTAQQVAAVLPEIREILGDKPLKYMFRSGRGSPARPCLYAQARRACGECCRGRYQRLRSGRPAP